MATEVAFAKSFLSLLDSKPPKISPDHVEDPRNYPGTSPYTLPRHPSSKPFSKPARHPPSSTTTNQEPPSSSKKNPGAEPALAVHLRSPRNPPLDLTLPAVAVSTSLAEIKERVAHETGIPLAKIKLLHGKKPVGDTKLLQDLVNGSDGTGGVELGVMVLGGAAGLTLKGAGVGEKKEEKGAGGEAGGASAGAGESSAPVAQGLSGVGVLETGQFWDDLKGFLQQRVRDEGVADQALGVFKGAWEGRMA